jgi:hypothetical protein
MALLAAITVVVLVFFNMRTKRLYDSLNDRNYILTKIKNHTTNGVPKEQIKSEAPVKRPAHA